MNALLVLFLALTPQAEFSCAHPAVMSGFGEIRPVSRFVTTALPQRDFADPARGLAVEDLTFYMDSHSEALSHGSAAPLMPWVQLQSIGDPGVYTTFEAPDPHRYPGNAVRHACS